MKYSINEMKSDYTVEMELVIRNITKSDLGIYFCNSTNSLGKADGSIRLYGKIFTAQLIFILMFVLMNALVSIVLEKNKYQS